MATLAGEVIKLQFGTVVEATDGEAGSITHLVIQPGQRTVTHIGVRLPGGTRVAVPLSRVLDATADQIFVSLTREAMLQTMPPLPTDQIVLANNTHVTANGRTGSLTHISLTASNAKFHAIGYRVGMNSVYVADARWITDIADDGSVTVQPPQGTEPRPYRADADVLLDAQTALFNYPRLRLDLRAVQLRVIDGEVWMTGNVSSTLNQRVMAELLESVKGLYTIHNTLVADTDLAVTVARALSQDPRTHGQPIGVYPLLGKVFLRGRAHDASIAQAATEVASRIGGHQEVVNQLAIQPSATFIPVLAPVTGDEDIIPGGD